ncbi:MAG: TIGR00341 family protein [bacterium]
MSEKMFNNKNLDTNNSPIEQHKLVDMIKATAIGIWHYIKELINLSEDTDSEMTIANINKSVEFRGDNVWVLFFAIIIASVGLNVNSTAVIIGAMLVSPLMSPIMGLGLSVGINDMILLRKSLKNLLIMITISLIASTSYFFLSPLSDAQSEILSRTTPTIFDVFIAFSGGLAGILASSRRQEKVTVISGVAIATALMPPLCTAGYGLATGQFSYFFGAFYLFFINSVFIALATFIMVRYMKFPRKKYLDPKREKRVSQMIIAFAIVVLLPSVFMAINVVRETSFNEMARRYVADVENSKMMEDVQVINKTRTYSRKGSEIVLSIVGKELTTEQIELIQERMDYFGLPVDTKLTIRQAAGATLDINTQATMLQGFIENKDKQIIQKDSIIYALRDSLDYEKKRSDITSVKLAAEVRVLYPNIGEITMSNAVKVNLISNIADTVPTINIKWTELPTSQESKNLERWLKVRIGSRKLDVINMQIPQDDTSEQQ